MFRAESACEGGTADPSVLRKFTSYLKDTEAGAGQLNYATFREHSSRIARFHMPDPVQGSARNPQRLNRYAYVANDPNNRVDPRGLQWEDFMLDWGGWDPWGWNVGRLGTDWAADGGGGDSLWDPWAWGGSCWNGWGWSACGSDGWGGDWWSRPKRDCDAEYRQCTRQIEEELNACLERASTFTRACALLCAAVCLIPVTSPACPECIGICAISALTYYTGCYLGAAATEGVCLSQWAWCKLRR